MRDLVLLNSDLIAPSANMYDIFLNKWRLHDSLDSQFINEICLTIKQTQIASFLPIVVAPSKTRRTAHVDAPSEESGR